MKKLVALPLAVLFIAACSESTAPSTSASLTPSFAKPVSGGGGLSPATGANNGYVDTYTFNNQTTVTAAAHSGIGTDTPDGSFQSSATALNFAPSDVTNGFIGRYNNTATRALVVLTTAGSKYTIDFNLYVIGSWDGKGKQAQNGAFLANVFQAAYRCGGGTSTVIPLFSTTFSNQKTVQQDFPAAFGLGGNKYATGSVPGSADALGYRSRPDLSNTPTFQSYGDVTYHLQYTIAASACGAGVAPTFVFSSTAPGQQSNWDESWGLDNINVLVDG